MQIAKKKLAALALAGLLGLGQAVAVPAVAAAEAAVQQQGAGTSTEYRQRMQAETETHEQNVRLIRSAYRQSGDRKQYDAAMEEEQLRHDNIVSGIRDDYNRIASQGRRSL